MILITGATGHIGNVLTKQLKEKNAAEEIRVLLLPQEDYSCLDGLGLEIVRGDIRSYEDVLSAVQGCDKVFHLAGMIDIGRKGLSSLYDVNVGGTRNVVDACLACGVKRLVYVSSVHAIPEKPRGCPITEDCKLAPGLVDGDYAKSKATATNLVLDAAAQGLNASVVFPSGIIGPGDVQGGSFTSMAESFLAGRLPFAVRGGYDFVDVRDVAQGLLACCEKGLPGKGYILSGHYATIGRMLQMVGAAAQRRYRPLCLPLSLAKLAAPCYERRSLRAGKQLFFTPYSVSVLGSNGQFSHSAATECFAYEPRPMEQTLQDMTAWLLSREKRTAGGN